MPGTKGLVRGPLGVPLPFEVLAVDESDPARRSWRWRAGALGVRVELEHVVEPDRSRLGGSRTVLVLSGPAPVVVPYLPVARVALHRLVRRAAGAVKLARGGGTDPAGGARPRDLCTVHAARGVDAVPVVFAVDEDGFVGVPVDR